MNKFGRPKKSIQDYHDVGWALGYRFIGAEIPKNTCYQTNWRCKQGHAFRARYNDIYNGINCSRCSGRFTKTKIDYQTLADQHNWAFTDNHIPCDTNTLTEWFCRACGHVRQTTYQKLKRHPKCVACYRKRGSAANGDKTMSRLSEHGSVRRFQIV